MTIEMVIPSSTEQVEHAIHALRVWQTDGGPAQLHPGDVGWHLRWGVEDTAQMMRVWRSASQIMAVGLLDGWDVFRLAVAPDKRDDTVLAWRVASDIMKPERGILPPGNVAVEARSGGPFRDLLLARGWQEGEPWTPLSRDLTAPVEETGLKVEVVGPHNVTERVAVQRASFEGSEFTVRAWKTMAASTLYQDAACLVAYDDVGAEVAAATVWSAGPGRPGLLEPVGVHRDHRRRGFGRAISLAAAAALRRMGATTALVCTEQANVAAVAAYRSAGFVEHPAVPDLERKG